MPGRPSPDDGRLGAAATAPAGVELRVLGACRLAGPGDAEGVTELSQAQRRLLARLGLGAPAPVRLEALAEAIWEGEPPHHLKPTIHNQISRVRAGHGETVVRTTPDGYLLGVTTDAARLRDQSAEAERLLDRGHAEAAYHLADATVPLWVGRPYDELDHVDAVHAVRRSLTASRQSAENTRLAAAIALGWSGWALHEAERLAGESPYDERRQAMLAQALALAGRRGDALGAVMTARRRLRADLGIEAGPLLRAVEEQVLSPSEAPRPQVSLDFVGREGEVRAVMTRLAQGLVVEVDGEPGIGVTRLLLEVGSHLRRLSVRTAYAATGDHQDSAVGLLEAVLDELGVQAGPRGVVAGFADAIATVTGEGPVAVLVDDADALGPTARRVLLDAARRELARLVLGGHGDAERDEEPAAGCERVPLPPLGRDAVARLALAAGDRALDAADIDRLLADSGGNPLVLQELLDAGSALDGTEAGTAPPSRLAAIAHTMVARLDPRQRAALERAAVAGGGFPVAALGPDGLAPAHLVSVAEETVRFRHGALREAIYQDIPPARREELHAELGRAAEAHGSAPSLVARHLLAAGPLAAGEALAACRAAAAGAGRHGAHADAAEWLRQGLALGLSRRDCLATRIELGDAQRLAGDPGHVDTLTGALTEALELGDERLVSDASFALLQLGGTTTSGSEPTEISALVDRAFEVLGAPELRAPVCGAASLAWSMTGQAARSRAYFDEAEGLARAAEDRARVLPFAYMALGMPGDLPRRRSIAEELIALGASLGDPAASFEGHQLAFSVRLQEGDGPGARGALAAMGGLVEVVGDVGRRWAHQFASAAIAHLDGDDDAAETLAEEAFALFAPVSESRAFAAQAGQLFGLRLTQGRLAELAETLGWLIAEQPGVPAWHAAYALAAVASDADAATIAEHATAALDLAEEDVTWLAAHVVGARATATIGHRGLARRYAERLAPWTERGVWQGTCSYGPVDTALALLHATLGDDAAAGLHAGRAREVARRLGAPGFLAEAERLV